jgi:hypothetical protein
MPLVEPSLGVVVPVGAGGARQLMVAKDAEFHRGGYPMVACASLRSAAITEDAMPDDIITADQGPAVTWPKGKWNPNAIWPRHRIVRRNDQCMMVTL